MCQPVRQNMNTNKHKQSSRQSIRLPGYDYSNHGWYYVTICTQNRKCIFGDIVGVGRDRPVQQIMLNDIGKTVENIWQSLPDHHSVELDTFQIMPNHVHFIIHIVTRGSRPNTGGSRPAPTTTTTTTAITTAVGATRGSPVTRGSPTLGTIIGLFKSECTKQIRCSMKNPQIKLWQRNYYEHIIRTESDLNKIRTYIKNNPKTWDRDRNNPKYFRTNLRWMAKPIQPRSVNLDRLASALTNQ